MIGLANAGPDLVSTMKQARDFGGSSKAVAMLVFANKTNALGLKVAQGLRYAVSLYEDMTDDTCA